MNVEVEVFSAVVGLLVWVNQVNYIVQKAWKAFHFVMRVLKKKRGLGMQKV